MSELIGIDSGTPQFDELVLKRYQEFPRIERELAECRTEIERLKAEIWNFVETQTKLKWATETNRELMSEIERLEAENEQYSEIVTGLREHARKHIELLARATDALERHNLDHLQDDGDLIQELRDATK